MMPWVEGFHQAACPAMAPGALGFPKRHGLRLYPAATGDVRMSKRFLSYSAAPALQT